MAKQLQKEQKVEVNRTIGRFLLLSSVPNRDGDKYGVSVLNYRGIEPNGQINLNGIDEPFISNWLTIADVPTVMMLKDMPVLSEIYLVVSGSGKYTRIHSVLTKEEYYLFKSLVADKAASENSEKEEE